MKKYKKIRIGLIIIIILINNIFGTDFEQGKSFFDNQEYYSAIKFFKQALKANIYDHHILFYLAEAYFRIGEFKNSVRFYKKVLDIEPTYRPAIIGLGNAYQYLSDFKNAALLYNELLKKDSFDRDAKFGLANIERLKGNTELAKKMFLDLLNIDPNYFWAVINLGSIYRDMGKLSLAEAYYKRAIKIDNNNEWGYINLGILYYNTEKKKKASEEFEKAKRLNPLNTTCNLYLSVIKTENGKFDEALKNIDIILKNNPNNYAALYGKSCILEKKKEHQEAGDTLKYLLSLTPDDEITRFYLEEVITSFKGSLYPLRIELSLYHKKRYLFYANKFDINKSLFELRRALFLNPQSLELHRLMAEHYRDENLMDKYIKELQSIIRLKPDDTKSHDRLEIALKDKKNKLYYKLGYELENIDNIKKKILIMNFNKPFSLMEHYESGKLIRRYILFYLQQLEKIKLIDSDDILNKFTGNTGLFRDLDLDRLIRKIDIDYIIYGNIREKNDRINIEIKLFSVASSILIKDYNYTFSNKNRLIDLISLFYSELDMDLIPEAKILNADDKNKIIINGGSAIGFKKHDIIKISDERIITKDPFTGFYLGKKERVIGYAKIQELDEYISSVRLIEGDFNAISEGKRVIVDKEKKKEIEKKKAKK